MDSAHHVADFLPPICRTSKQLYAEATPEYIKSRCFMLSDRSSAQLLRGWLSTLSLGFTSIRALNVSLCGSRHDYHDATGAVACHWALILRCQNLTHLTIRLPNYSEVLVARRCSDPKDPRWESRMRLLQLEKLVEVKRLRVLMLHGVWLALRTWVDYVFRVERPDVVVKMYGKGGLLLVR
ncbi:hypothetical protein BU26DRAFT_513527 [Trematosphaeria pertusa]|uniref:Uncharacterized protein n=1 Tax=Trematosphaeria pertusa TaxID=390896 RepID=A0A6A6J1S4_9PLEO|nr:uncharacterized protein BU26DRAFT_513527 [Trematosphaeria pertusa]KAF2256744.1 hypothetical protein BU26DRAFT_513527 [Trematosphaeria pertusa]